MRVGLFDSTMATYQRLGKREGQDAGFSTLKRGAGKLTIGLLYFVSPVTTAAES